MQYRPTEERFSEKYKLDYETGCWVWQAMTIKGGYGMLSGSRGNSSILAHRFSYQNFIGPIPEGKWVLHSCDNPGCVNPKHLFLGDQGANMKDMERKGRARILSVEQIKLGRQMLATGASQTKVSAFFGVSRSTLALSIKRSENRDEAPFQGNGGGNSPRYTKLTDEDKRMILKALSTEEKVSAIARMFNCDRKTIRNIRDNAAIS